MASGHRRHFEARQRPEAPGITSTHPVDLKSVEPIQKYVNNCEQRIVPENNATALLKSCHQ